MVPDVHVHHDVPVSTKVRVLHVGWRSREALIHRVLCHLNTWYKGRGRAWVRRTSGEPVALGPVLLRCWREKEGVCALVSSRYIAVNRLEYEVHSVSLYGS